MADIALVQTGRAPALRSPGAMTMRPVVLTQRGVLRVDSTLRRVTVNVTFLFTATWQSF